MTTALARPEPLKGAVAGLAAGLAASFVMSRFQALVAKLSPSDDEQSEPATEKAADTVSQVLTGEPVPGERKPLAGEAVHYAFGAALGVAYGLIAEYRPQITTGYGTAYGMGVAMLADEVAVPVAGLAAPPQEVPLATHAYGVISHLVFGGAIEASRRLVRETL